MKKEKYCKNCGCTKPVSEFYSRGRNIYDSHCRICRRIKENEKNRLLEPDLQKVLHKPNTYTCDKQRRDVFNIMISLGWTFHKPSGVWYKDGVKDKHGRWSNVSSADIPRKICNCCEKLLPVTNFYMDRTHNCYQYVCIDCKRIIRKAYYKKNKK